MTALALMALLVAGQYSRTPGNPGGASVRHTVKGLSFELPAAWRIAQRSDTTRFEAPGGSAYVLVDIDTVEAEGLDAETCRARMREKLFRGTWTETKVNRYAVLRSSTIERSPNLESQARIDRMVGCDGRKTWSLMFVSELRNWAYTARIASHALESVLPASEAPPSRTDS